ncbi:hypothetical protein TIFTF001_013581 [Ficus carica]|uniref:Starch synthase catalytic domain-containing protein n=1 Tax=Ficus carica TaxID=3494 RepID=A0AA88A3Q9_FICCA|nr:hypothetical protein TIFTF001_013581 [Ficus carica]
MECLRIPGVAVPCSYYSFPNSVKASNFSSSGVVCLAPSRRGRRRSRKNGCLRLSGSVLGESDDRENQTSQIYKDRPKEEGKGLVLGTQRGSSGSVIGFHLIPPSGDVEVAEPPKDVDSDEVEEAEGVDEKVFVDHPSYHRPGNPYGDNYGAYGDNQFRYTLLCHAACEAPLVLPLGGYTYGEKCMFLVNDWHAGLVSALLAAKYRPHGVYKDARSILVIHNLAHQGVEPAATYMNLGLPPEWYGALGWVFPTWARTHALDTGEAVNILKGAVVTADRILTVSKGYSWEITTPEGGYGLQDLLRSRKSVLNGITNGIDDVEWDPSSDKHIAFHFSAEDLSGKAQCKIALQKELGFPVRPDCPLIGFIGRLDYQKGIDVIQQAMPEIMQDDVQFVMLGSGDPRYEEWMRATESVYSDKFRGWVGFNVPISHRITASCDIQLMPSRFEPCGLNQLYAMRYGTIPVVHCTGGLGDTVETFNPYAQDGKGEGTGWAFSPLQKESMLGALRVAIQTFREHKSSWEGLKKRGMQKDFTWETAAKQYEQAFDWAFTDPPYVS